MQLRHGVLHDHGVLVPNAIVHCKDPLATKTLEEVTTDPRLKLEGARHRGGSYLNAVFTLRCGRVKRDGDVCENFNDRWKIFN